MHNTNGPLGQIDPTSHINIIGAGISGLVMGHYLKKKGLSFTIFEKEDHVGGKIGTANLEHGKAEKAANAVFTNDDVIELLRDLNLSYFAANRKLKKFVFRGKPCSPPIKTFEILSTIFKIFKKVPTSSNISVADFFRPLLGDEMTREVLSAGLGGVYATDASKLHFQSIFKISPKPNQSYLSYFKSLKKARVKQENKANSVSFENGMQSFIDALKDELKDHIKISSKQGFLPNSIICTDASEAAEILSPINHSVANELNKVEYTQTTTATLLTENKLDLLEKSFGMLFPPSETQINSLGILSNSEIFPNRTKNPKWNSYTFIVKSTNDIERKISEDLAQIMGYKHFLNASHELKISKWNRAIPVYTQARYDAILNIKTQLLKSPGQFVIFGNYVGGISIREMISMAKEFVNKL